MHVCVLALFKSPDQSVGMRLSASVGDKVLV